MKLNKQCIALSRGAQRFQFLCHHYLHSFYVPCFSRTYGEVAHTGDAGLLVDASEIVGGYGVSRAKLPARPATSTSFVCRGEWYYIACPVWTVAGQRQRLVCVRAFRLIYYGSSESGQFPAVFSVG